MKEPTCRVCKTADHVELQWVCEQCGGRDTAMDVEDEIAQLTERAEEFQNLAQMNQSENKIIASNIAWVLERLDEIHGQVVMLMDYLEREGPDDN